MMERHASRAVLAEPGQSSAQEPNHLTGVAEELLFRRQRGRSTVIVLTSVRPAAGVTYVTGLVAAEIARLKALDSLVITMEEAMRLPDQPEESEEDTFVETTPHVWVAAQDSLQPQPLGPGAIPKRIRELQNWPGTFVLLDCPALNHDLPAEILSMADGVVLVVAAGETSQADLARAAAGLNESGAPIIGMILNKRTYAIPKSIFRYV